MALLVLHVDVSTFLHQEAGYGSTGVGGVVYRDARVLSHLQVKTKWVTARSEYRAIYIIIRFAI